MATETNRPKIQADDVFRDMTDDEHAAYLAMQESKSELVESDE